MARKKLLLHVCCGPCATWAIEFLLSSYDLTLFFSNSNIFPLQEYKKRLQYAKHLADIHNLALIEDDYNHNLWLNFIHPFELEPEGGKRCDKCFEFNLGRASAYALQHGYDYFTTTLTISPYKDTQKIFAVGNKFKNYLAIDFKQEDGYKKSIQLSKKHCLYRQKYCGCEFSIRK